MTTQKSLSRLQSTSTVFRVLLGFANGLCAFSLCVNGFNFGSPSYHGSVSESEPALFVCCEYSHSSHTRLLSKRG